MRKTTKRIRDNSKNLTFPISALVFLAKDPEHMFPITVKHVIEKTGDPRYLGTYEDNLGKTRNINFAHSEVKLS